MDWLRLVNGSLSLLVALAAWLVTRRDRNHVWVAAYLTLFASADAVHFVFTGLADGWAGRAVVRAYELSLSLFFVACCMYYFVRRKPWLPIAMLVAASALSITPWGSGARWMTLFVAINVVAVVSEWLCIFWGLFRRRDLEPSISHLVLIFFATTDFAMLMIPFTRGILTHMPVARVGNLLLLVVCLVAYAQVLRRSAGTTPAPGEY